MTTGCRELWYVACVGFVLLGLAAGVARGGFVVVEDFDDLELGSINNQDGWRVSGLSGDVVTLPGEGANQVLEVTVDSGVLHRDATIPNGATRMLFLRFRFEGQHNYSFGMSQYSLPDEFSHFSPELRKSDASDSFKIHDGHTYADLTTLGPATWYNLWALVDNDSGNTQVWLHLRPGEGAVAADQLDSAEITVFDFRTDLDRDLVKFYIKAADGGSGRDPLWIDDIYLEESDGLNLTNPVPEPHSLVYLASLLTVAACHLCRRGRRR